MLVIQRAGWIKWTYFFEVFGRNPLFIFILSGVTVRIMSLIRVDGISLNSWIYQHVFANTLEGRNASLLFALSFMLILWIVAFWMDRKKIYVKV
jgi:predicted acyltransferase